MLYYTKHSKERMLTIRFLNKKNALYALSMNEADEDDFLQSILWKKADN